MRNILVVCFMLVCALVCNARTKTQLSFLPCDNIQLNSILGVMNACQLTASIINDSIDARFYELWLVKCDNGHLTRKPLGYTPVDSAHTDICITVVAVDSMTSHLFIDPARNGQRQTIIMPTHQSLLIECENNQGFLPGDSIPLVAYSTGRYKRMDLGNDIVVQGWDICGVRSSGIHPSEWYSQFDIHHYFYIEAVPVDHMDFIAM